MITIDKDRCNGCGTCLQRFAGYCLREEGGIPAIEYAVCNQCQKCVALCPRGAFLVNGVRPLKIKTHARLDADELERFLEQRRSIKKFQDKPVPRAILERIAAAAAYAPNQNKNINLLIIDDTGLLRGIYDEARRATRLWHRIFFTPNPVALLARAFLGRRQYRLLQRKMEFSLRSDANTIKNRAAAVMAVYGNPRVPVTAPSAPFLLSTMLLMAQCLGVGSTLMDALKLAINFSPTLKKRLGVPRGHRIFGVLALGYPDEKIINIPQGYSVPVAWNRVGNTAM